MSAAEVAVAPAAGRIRRRRSAGSVIWRYRLPAVAVLVLLIAALSAVFAPWLAPYSPIEGELGRRLVPPAWSGGSGQYVFGTDHQGRDVLSRLLYGGRVSLLVGFVSVAVAGLLGTLLGTIAGYYRGPADEVIMRIADIQLSFPFLGLAIAVVAVLGPGLTNVMVVLGVSGWILFARVVRAELLSLREQEFVTAARAMGAGDWGIVRHHLLPNILSPVVVVATFAFAQMVITEASLSFLGLGVQPPTPTWGGMLNDSRDYMQLAWWLATLPGVALLVVVLAVNLLGDWLRDELDPRLRLD